MNGPAVGITTFLCLFGAAWLGVTIQERFPALAERGQAHAVVQRAVWIIAVMAGILLSATTVYLKIHFDTADRDVRAFSFQIVDLDNALRRLGPPAEPSRALLFRYAARTMKDVWPESKVRLGPDDSHANRIYADLEASISRIPVSGGQNRDPGAATRDQITHIHQLLVDVGRARWTLDERTGRSLSPWMMSLVVLWLMVTFGSLGTSIKGSRAALAGLGMCAAMLSSAVFLAVEYADPYEGIIIVSSEPMRNALFSLSD